MDLEVVGRHALFFDDDAMAAFVNSGDALVNWNSLQIDRYDVRHLLSAPLPPRRRRNPQISSQIPDFAFESELDLERYSDLPSPSDKPGTFVPFFCLLLKYILSLVRFSYLVSSKCYGSNYTVYIICKISLELMSR